MKFIFLQICATFASKQNQCGKQDIYHYNKKVRSLEPYEKDIPLRDDFLVAVKDIKIVECNHNGQRAGCIMTCADQQGDLKLIFLRVVPEKKLECRNYTPLHLENGFRKNVSAKIHLEKGLKLKFNEHKWVPCIRGKECRLQCEWFEQELILHMDQTRKTPSYCEQHELHEGVKPYKKRVPVDALCKKGYELTKKVTLFFNRVKRQGAAFRQSRDDIYVTCSKRWFYLMQLENPDKWEFDPEKTLQAKGNRLCAQAQECKVGELNFQDRLRNKEEMYEFSVDSFKHGAPATVKCKHAPKTTQLHCFQGEVLPDYNCPEVDQKECPTDLKNAFNVDVQYGCVLYSSVSLVQFKCKNLSEDRSKSFDLKWFKKNKDGKFEFDKYQQACPIQKT